MSFGQAHSTHLKHIPAPHLRTHRRLLLAASLLVVLCSATTLAVASHRIAAEQAAFAAPASGRCTPTTLNRSAVLPGTSLAVSPLPDSYDALPQTQISLLGVPAGALSHVEVRGSATGSHGGELRAYSQGDGASFVPSIPFLSGETVTVKGRLAANGHTQPFAFHFVVARADTLPHVPSLHPSKDPGEKMHFRSAPSLEPPSVVLAKTSPSAERGYILTAPYNGPGQAGPMIFDEAGNLVWFDPLGKEEAAANLQVQQLDGQPVLTWWQGYIPPQGFGVGEEVIANSAYQVIARVRAGNGHKADLHDFHITPQDTAVLTAFQPLRCDLSSLGGPHGGAVTDSLFQEVDLRTGLVRREWNSVDHIPLADSYSSAVTTSLETPFDYFHLNSVDQLSAGRTLISARNTWGLYELNSQTGQVLVNIGGKRSNVKLAGGANTAYQHDATVLGNGEISIFDNGGVPMVHPQSRALIESITAGTANVVSVFEHPQPLKSGSQGNVQALANGDFFVGWGAEPYFSEFSPSGELLYDSHFHGSYQAYRAYRSAWAGAPATRPAAVLSGSPSHQRIYVSWNGDTRTATWRLLDGTSSQTLTPVANATRTGFETTLTPPSPAPYFAVQALDASGAVIGTSATIHG